jgi:hypothetical protein
MKAQGDGRGPHGQAPEGAFRDVPEWHDGRRDQHGEAVTTPERMFHTAERAGEALSTCGPRWRWEHRADVDGLLLTGAALEQGERAGA